MEHPLYEEWVFTPEDLAPGQREKLAAHLQTCERCQGLAQAWGQVAPILAAAPLQAPAPGFVQRWTVRLEAERARSARRQSLAILMFVLLAAALLFGSLVMLSLPVVQSPTALLWTWITRLVSLATFADGTRELAATVVRTAAKVVPLGVWVLLTGIASLLATLWVVSFRLLTAPRRITQ